MSSVFHILLSCRRCCHRRRRPHGRSLGYRSMLNLNLNQNRLEKNPCFGHRHDYHIHCLCCRTDLMGMIHLVKKKELAVQFSDIFCEIDETYLCCWLELGHRNLGSGTDRYFHYCDLDRDHYFHWLANSDKYCFHDFQCLDCNPD